MEGIEFLHRNKIFHSDIKPANILFTRNDDLKLCDFGIAVNNCTDSRAVARLLYQGGPSGSQGGQAKFSKYFSLVENHLKLVLKF